MHVSTVKNEDCVDSMESRRSWELRKVQIPFIAINFISEYSKYFVSMLHYELLNKKEEEQIETLQSLPGVSDSTVSWASGTPLSNSLAETVRLY